MTEVNPQRLQIMVALSDLLATVSVENGYKNDIVDVYRGRALFGTKDKLPFVSILDQPVPDAIADVPPDSGVNDLRMPLIVQGFAKEDLNNPTDPAMVLMVDVRKCLAQHKQDNKRTHNLLGLNGTVTDLKIGVGTVRPPEAGVSNVGFFWMLVTILGAENLLDPYEWATRR